MNYDPTETNRFFMTTSTPTPTSTPASTTTTTSASATTSASSTDTSSSSRLVPVAPAQVAQVAQVEQVKPVEPVKPASPTPAPTGELRGRQQIRQGQQQPAQQQGQELRQGQRIQIQHRGVEGVEGVEGVIRVGGAGGNLGQHQHQHATVATVSATDRDCDRNTTTRNLCIVGVGTGTATGTGAGTTTATATATTTTTATTTATATATATATHPKVAPSLLSTPGTVDSSLLTPGNGNGNPRTTRSRTRTRNWTRTPSTGSGEEKEKERDREREKERKARENSRSIDGTISAGTNRDEMSPNRIRTLPTWVSRRSSSSSSDADNYTPNKQPATSTPAQPTPSHPTLPEPSHRRVPQTSNPGSIHDSQREKTPVTPLPAGAHGQSRWRAFIEDTAMVPPRSRDGPRRVSVSGGGSGMGPTGTGGRRISVAGLSSGLSEVSTSVGQRREDRRESLAGSVPTVSESGASAAGYRKNYREEEKLGFAGKEKENFQHQRLQLPTQPKRRASISDPLIFSGGETTRIGKRPSGSFGLHEEERRILGDLGDDMEERKESLDGRHTLDRSLRKDSKESKRYKWKGKDREREREKEGGRKIWEYQNGDGSSTGGYDVPYDPESAEELIMRVAEERVKMEREKVEKEKKKEGESWLDGLADLALPWLAGGKVEEGGEGGIMEDRELRELVTAKQKKRNCWQKFYTTLLNSPIVPLTCRSIIWLLSLIALSLATNIFHLSHLSKIPQKASTVMAIVVDGIALIYLIYITYDEISGKPLGLRSPNTKIRLIMCDLVFIVFDSANLSLAFDTLFDVEWTCRSGDYDTADADGYGNLVSMTNHPICQRQKALSAFLFLALGAWVLTFTVSIFRVVERVNKGGRQ